MKIKIDYQPYVAFIIPTLNEEKRLESCLVSIAFQNYPQNKIQIIISDGGSKDKTLEIAKKFKCLILNNYKKLAEPGVSLGLQNSTSEINFILAADNILEGKNWIIKMLLPFEDDSVIAAFPKQVSTKDDNWMTKYDNTFTDPFNHYVYADAANARTYFKIYEIIKKTNDYIIYEFPLYDHPLIAFAQGFAIRSKYKKKKGMEFDDILPIIEIIKNKQNIAYVNSAHLIHHTTKNLAHYIKKQKWAIVNGLSGKSYGVSQRIKYFSFGRKMKMYLWPFYSISIFLPIINSIRGLIIDKEKLWIYHSIVSFIVASIFWIEVIKIKILKLK